MRIHEYQAKAIAAQFGIPCPRGGLAATPQQARDIAADLGRPVVLKAQVHAGGRGRAGGIRPASTPQEAEKVAAQMLGASLVTAQTSATGIVMRKLLVEEALSVEREFYLGITIDGCRGLPVFIASPSGGIEIEEVAQRSPESVRIEPLDPVLDFSPFQRWRLASVLGLPQDLFAPAMDIMVKLYRTFIAKDCSLAEVNPLALTEGRLLALDMKLDFDDNALFRHPELSELRDQEQLGALELQALSLGLRNYIKLEGNIACMVNGAGLSMAVLDLITSEGGKPANFLDIGTLNTPERVVNAFHIFLADPSVKAVLINIFGGMARVDIIAQGIVEAYKTLNISLPVVVRLAGTNVEEGRKIIAQSGVPVIEAQDMAEAASKVVAVVGRA